MAVSRKRTPKLQSVKKTPKKNKMNAVVVTNEEGVKFRSKFEERAYRILTEEGIPFAYEPCSVLLVPAETGVSPSYEHRKGKGMIKVRDHLAKITYTPDFVGDGWVMETKGMRTGAFDMRWKLFRMALSKGDYHPLLLMPNSDKEVRESISLIREHCDVKEMTYENCVNGQQMLRDSLGEGAIFG